MGSYYDFFSGGETLSEVNFVVPYYDAFGLGELSRAFSCLGNPTPTTIEVMGNVTNPLSFQ